MSKYLSSHRKKIQFGQKMGNAKRQEDDLASTNLLMCTKIFDGKLEISCEDYLDFRNNLQELLWHYEFHQFVEDKRGRISCYDFAKSLYVHYFPFNLMDTYLEHLS